MKFNKLNVPTHWQNYWTRYPEGHTILEALISWISQVDEMVDNQNNLNTTVENYGLRLDDFLDLFDTNLRNTVEETLKDWQTSGFLNVIINEALQWQLDRYIVTNEQDKLLLNAQFTQKVNFDYFQSVISTLGTGGPQDIFYSISALETAYPDGQIGTYLVLDSTFTGGAHSFIWDGTTWVDLGVYQSVSVPDRAVTVNKLADNVTEWNGYRAYAKPKAGSVENIIFVEKVFDIGSLAVIGRPTTQTATCEFYTDHTNITHISARKFESDSAVHGEIQHSSGTYTSTIFPSVTATHGKTQSYDQKTTFTSEHRYVHLMIRVDVTDVSIHSDFYVKNIGLSIDGQIVPEVTAEVKLYGVSPDSTLSLSQYGKFNLVTHEILSDFAKASETDKTRWYGGTANFLGDSTTKAQVGPTSPDKGYATLVSKALGLTERNYGVNGTRIAQQTGETNSFVERYASMASADLIVVAGGINDFFSGTAQLGESDSTDPYTFNGALNVLMSGLKAQFPLSDLLFMTPIQSYFGGRSTDEPNPNSNATLNDYRQAILNRAEYHGIATLDLYALASMDGAHSAEHRQTYFSDGLHWNDRGNERIANRLIGHLKSI